MSLGIQARTALTDEELGPRYQATGDPEYFAQIFARHRRLIFCACRRFFGSNTLVQMLRRPQRSPIRSSCMEFFHPIVPVMKAPGNMFKFLRRQYEAQPSTQSFRQSFTFPNSTFGLSPSFAGAVQGQENNSAPFAAAPATTAATAAATAATAPATATTAPTPREHSTKRRD